MRRIVLYNIAFFVLFISYSTLVMFPLETPEGQQEQEELLPDHSILTDMREDPKDPYPVYGYVYHNGIPEQNIRVRIYKDKDYEEKNHPVSYTDEKFDYYSISTYTNENGTYILEMLNMDYEPWTYYNLQVVVNSTVIWNSMFFTNINEFGFRKDIYLNDSHFATEWNQSTFEAQKPVEPEIDWMYPIENEQARNIWLMTSVGIIVIVLWFGHAFPEQDDFCRSRPRNVYRGAPPSVRTTPRTHTDPGVTCSYCGSHYRSGRRKCESCGASLR